MTTGSVADTQQSGIPRSERSEKNIQQLEEAYAWSQGKSIGRAAVELDISRSSIERMLRKDIKAFAYKFPYEQTLLYKTAISRRIEITDWSIM